MFSLDTKTILITGAAGLLGTEHCRAVLNAGAKLVMVDINIEGLEKVKTELQKIPNSIIISKQLDITNKDEVEKFCATLKNENIDVNVLINNAAIDHKTSKKNKNNGPNNTRFENFSPDVFMKEVGVGLTGAMICASVFGKKMAERQTGTIINIASDLSIIAPDQRLYEIEGLTTEEQSVKPASYSVIKHGMHGLTKYLASYWGSKNIRTNTLSPSGVETINMPDEFKQKLIKLIPQGRMAKLDEYHGTLVYLCSDSSSFMNGQNIVIDGGRSII